MVVGADKDITDVLKSLNPTPVANDWPPNKSIDVVADKGRGAIATAETLEELNPTLMLLTATLPVPDTPNWNDNVQEYVPAGRLIAKVLRVPLTTADVVWE